MNFEKLGRVFNPKKSNSKWWYSHCMAPSAVLLNDGVIRVFIGCWDKNGISRIGYVDVNARNPLEVIEVCENPVLDIGADGAFDENGVFPAHASKIDDKIFLYYTGFQLGHKVRHYNFGGLAIGDLLGTKFKRYQNSPILDRKNEGLLVRAGQSIYKEGEVFHTLYSAGSAWARAGGKLRPTYDVYYQASSDGVNYEDQGLKIISANHDIEHGLGRPQILKIKGKYYAFYTRRLLSMKYFFGISCSDDLKSWYPVDNISGIEHEPNAWDSEMIYFPSVVDMGDFQWLFYCGNNFGETGFGVARMVVK